MKDRIDKVLVKQGFTFSRSQANLLIKEGYVYHHGKQVKKSNYLVEDKKDGIEIRKEHHYVGRGAEKLLDAVKIFEITFQNKIVADIGASTGGFTEVALLEGASTVYAIDVGHDQLAQKILEDGRVVNIDKTNIRDLERLPVLVDICLVDLSFISLKLVMKKIFDLLKSDGSVIALFKPQFEVGKERVNKKGVVKNDDFIVEALEDFYQWCCANGFYIHDAKKSSVPGKKGNVEFFFYFKKRLSSAGFHLKQLSNLIGVSG